MSRHHRDRNSRSRIAGKLAATSSFAAAGLGFLSGAEADAAVVPYAPPGGPITIYQQLCCYPHNFLIDINGDGTSDFYIYDEGYFGDYRISDTSSPGRIMNDGSLAAIVVPGGMIGPDSTGWLTGAYMDNFLGTRGYAGVVFDIPGGSPHFGYLEFAMAADRSSLTLYGGAYESLANTPIQTPIPEPASLVLLASGASGLAAWRRRRRTDTSC